jgi:hypothetical protein
MDAALAEAMWRPPDCAASQEALWSGDRSTMSPEQVEAISQQVEACRELANRYTGSLDARFDLEIESVEPFQGGWSEPAWIVKARLIGTRVSGPMGEELARFYPDQLPLPTGADVPEAAAAMVAIATPPAPVAAAEPGTVLAAAVEPGAAGAEKLTSDGGEVVQAAATAGAAPVAEVVPDAELAARLAAADVGGVRLGMSLAEAEAAIRSAIEVAQVAALSEEAKEEARRAVAQWTPGVEPPYLEYRAYVGSDPGQAFVVFSHAAQRDAVLAVLRQVTVKGADVREALLAQLVERLGPALEGREQPDDPHVWTAHPGEVDAAAGWTPDMAFGSGTCRVDVGSGRADQIIEGGAEHPLRIRALSYSGKDLADPRRWRSCGPTVIAELRYDYDAGTVLTYALMDHAAYAPVYEAMVEAQKPAPVAIPKLWQD